MERSIRIKRFFAVLLTLAIIVTSINISAFVNPSAANEVAAGNGKITLLLQFNYPEAVETISNKKIKLNLLKDGEENSLKTIDLDGTTKNASFSVGTSQASVSIVPLGEDGVQQATDTIHYYQVDFTNLPNKTNYKVALEGVGYKTFLSETIKLIAYSKTLLVSTKSNTFTMGDVNSDKKVDADDRDLVSNALGTVNAQADLNGDGVVDIEDIALVNHNIDAKDSEEIFETEAIGTAVVDIGDMELSVNVDGKLENIFKENTDSVKFTNSSTTKQLEIPIPFTVPVEMEQISISSPSIRGAIEKGTISITYMDGNEEVEEKIPFDYNADIPEGVHALFRNEGKDTVYINLGRRVAVKRVTVTVEKVKDEDGNVTYAVMDEIKFLKDIVPENPDLGNSIPQKFSAEAGDEQVALSWKAVSNVTGYVVKFGLEAGVYTDQVSTEVPNVVVKGLENDDTYYFSVYAVNDSWTGKMSPEVSATPQSKKRPLPPDHLKLISGDQSLEVSWGKTKDADSYSIYYRKSSVIDKEYTKATSGLTELKYIIGSLENNVEYEVYITASNEIGESDPSLVSAEIPKKEEIIPPVLPSLYRIPNSNVEDIKMKDPNNVDLSFYPNGFNVENVLDGNFNTHWTGNHWTNRNTDFIYTFKEPKTMDYALYVPRLDSNYKTSYWLYTIKVWDSNGNEKVLADQKVIPNNVSNDKYAILPFPKTEDIKKIGIWIRMWDGAPTVISLSEAAFYEYSGINDEVAALFTDASYTKLAAGVTSEKLDDIELRLKDVEGYYVNKNILLDEVSIARGLLDNSTSVLGKVLDGIQNRGTSGDLKVVNTFQPLGVVGLSNDEVIVYADIPEGETVKVVPTQYFAEASSWSGSPTTLVKGRNIIKIPKLTTISTQAGGALYLQYSGTRGDEVKIQVRGKYTKIPVLELADWDSLTEEVRIERIDSYINELQAYVTAQSLTDKNVTLVKNSTEISLPNVLLSLPAYAVLDGITGGIATQDEKVERLYDNTLAWDDLLTVLYRTHGVDDITKEHSRQNIRYARMFSNAFMYASGAHIGIGYDSTKALVKGRPVSQTGFVSTNGLYGWGIAHEVGHVLDTLGKAEITNNIYSLFGQTYDGNQNILTSRLEGGIYDQVFNKTAMGDLGQANNVFITLGMYWQLHLAYDGADDNFFNLVNKEYRAGTYNEFVKDERFAVVASKVANKDLTEFFRRWGLDLSDEAKTIMSSFEIEDRKIYFLNDESRRARLRNEDPITGEISVQASINEKEATITISGLEDKNDRIQGYEISRNGKGITFTKELTYTDLIGSMNNMEITYSVRAIDLLGNVIVEASAAPIKISHNNLVSRDDWTYSVEDDGSILVKFMNDKLSIAGIKVNGIPGVATSSNSEKAFKSSNLYANILEDMGTLSATDSNGIPVGTDSNVPVATDSNPTVPDIDEDEMGIIVKTDKGAKKLARTIKKDALISPEEQIFFFTYENADEGRIATYDPKEVSIIGLPEELTMEDIDFISYPGDNIEISSGAIGHIKEDYRYGDAADEVIKAGTLIVTGSYRGDPVFNTIHINGRFMEGNVGEEKLVERAINGYALLFAEIPEEGDMTTINNGFWIFVPDSLKESELTGQDHCNNSLLPAEIQAVLFRTNSPEGGDGNRVVSNSLWILSPTEETMPDIVLGGVEN